MHRGAPQSLGLNLLNLVSLLLCQLLKNLNNLTDEWFDSEKQRIDGLEVQLKALVKALQNVSAQRYGEYFTIPPTYLSDVQDLASSLAEYSESLLELSRQFIHSDELTKLFQMLADLSAQSKRGLDELVKNDASSFAATVDEYMRVIGSIKVRPTIITLLNVLTILQEHF